MTGPVHFCRRPSSACISGNESIPLRFSELDYLFVQVALQFDDMNREELVQGSENGLLILPVSILIETGIVSFE